MAAITSSTTVAQGEAEYADTLFYRSPIDVDLAHRHLAAIQFLIMKRPSSAAKGPNTFSLGIPDLRREADDLEKWLARHDPNYTAPNKVIYGDFRNSGRV